MYKNKGTVRQDGSLFPAMFALPRSHPREGGNDFGQCVGSVGL